jgi:hypothetical protein
MRLESELRFFIFDKWRFIRLRFSDQGEREFFRFVVYTPLYSQNTLLNRVPFMSHMMG